ncbi:hypothetical protein TEA_014979 [Camellia sinensis var. sinensis]|uniref:Uncharacterized protein n=1 Tax=Camellia sinensis var. sinensis TaxID=542762 RepID=A0A4S4DQ42_CAMSN|nr:hypothetical protein TEA_014979 [Camellia sinensis var. sinensis]
MPLNKRASDSQTCHVILPRWGSRGGGPSAPSLLLPLPVGSAPGAPPGAVGTIPQGNNKPRRESRQGTRTKRARSCAASREKTKRLSATDISALASMKNVAKCDTWCELQNLANHQVFQRKLCPKPLGLGHVCLGVSRCVALRADVSPPQAPARGRPKSESPTTDDASRRVMVDKPLRRLVCVRAISGGLS